MNLKAIIITTILVVAYAYVSNEDYNDAVLAHQAQSK
jgi:hypothetical protein